MDKKGQGGDATDASMSAASVYDVAVVGGGPAGLVAAAHSAMRGLRSITFEAQRFGGQLVTLYPSKPVRNFPAHLDVASGELARRLADQAAHFGANLEEHEAVEFIGRPDPEMGFVVRTTTRQVNARTVLLAVGLGRFLPRRLGLQDEDRFAGRGLLYQLPAQDAITARRALVVGGGDTAVDTAMALKEIVPEVTLVYRRSLRAFEHSQQRLRVSGVRVLADAEVVELGGNRVLDHVLVSVENQELLELPVDLLLVSVGQVPDLGGLAGWDLKLPLDGCHLPVHPSMGTAVSGVYAAGDFVTYPGKVKMITTAVAEGSTAAAAIERHLQA